MAKPKSKTKKSVKIGEGVRIQPSRNAKKVPPQKEVLAKEQAANDAQEENEVPQQAGPVAKLKATNRFQNASDEKTGLILFFRTALGNELAKLNKQWHVPTKAQVIEAKEDERFEIYKEVKGKKLGCNFALRQETANFELLTADEDSINALGAGVGAYLDAYDKWRNKNNEQDNPAYEPIFELAVTDEKYIQGIVDQLSALGKTVAKITLTKDGETKELSKDEIAKYQPKEQANNVAKI